MSPDSVYRINPPKVKGAVNIMIRKYGGPAGGSKYIESKSVTITDIDLGDLNGWYGDAIKAVQAAVAALVKEKTLK